MYLFDEILDGKYRYGIGECTIDKDFEYLAFVEKEYEARMIVNILNNKEKRIRELEREICKLLVVECSATPLSTHDEDEEKEVIGKLHMNNKEPSYYCSDGLSPLSAFKKGLMSKEEVIGFCKGNVIKYTVRAGKKDDVVKDIDKAIDYLENLKEVL